MLVMVVQAYNPSAEEVETGGSLELLTNQPSWINKSQIPVEDSRDSS